MPAPMFYVLDESTLLTEGDELSLPSPGRPGEWMSGTLSGISVRLTTHPKDETWGQQPLRLFVAEYRGKQWQEEDLSRGVVMRNVAAKSVRLIEEVTPRWLGLDQRPDIRAWLVSEFRKANGNDAELPEWASLQSKGLKGARLDNLQLFGADIRDSNLAKASLSRSVLNYADMRGCDLTNADLESAGAEGAEFSGAKLNGAALSSGVFEGAHFGRAEMRRVKCHGTNFSGADLRGADLRDAEFHYAQLGHSFLAGASLAGASFQDANLSETDLRGVAISRNQLLQCGWLDGVMLKGAIVDGKVLGGHDAQALLAQLRRKSPHLFADYGQEIA